MTFICTKCGACCRDVRKIRELAAYAKPDGSCKHLKADRTCAIYKKRPAVCRVEDAHRLYAPSMSDEQWDEIQAASCRSLQKLYQIDAYGNPNVAVVR